MSAINLTPRALYQDVAELLRQRIFAGELSPGTWLDEMRLADEMGISRTPLREAIKVLAAEGLVTMKVRRGAYVTEVSEQDLREVYELLSVLEADAAAAVCRSATEADLKELQQLHDALETSSRSPGDAGRDRFFRANEAFHLRMLELGRNRWRSQVVADLRKVMKLNRHHSLFKTGRLQESLQEHRGILQALLARDAALAAERMRAHFLNGLEAAA